MLAPSVSLCSEGQARSKRIPMRKSQEAARKRETQMWEGWLSCLRAFLENAFRMGWWGWLGVATGCEAQTPNDPGSVWDQESGVGHGVDVTEDVLCASPYDLLFPLPSHSCD